MKQTTIKLSADLSSSSLPERALWSIRKKTFRIDIPESFSEIPKDKFIDTLAPLMDREFSSEENEGLVLTNIARALFDIPDVVFNNISPDDMYSAICEPMEWILTERLTNPYVKGFYHKDVHYALPMEDLLNATLHEFINADNQYMKLLKEGGVDNITNLVAIILRESVDDPDEILIRSDVRMPFERLSYTKRIKALSDLDIAKKFYIVYFFSCCKQLIFEKYAEAFTGDEKETVTTINSVGENYWEDVLTDVAETGVFGSYQEILNVPVHAFFQWLKKVSLKEKQKAKQEFQNIIKQHHKKFEKA